MPQVVVKVGERRVNLLVDAGHRAGDAIVRCSALQQELQDAFKAVQKGDAGPLAKIAPTSLVFGVWDSRDTQAKLPRLIASTIRAFNVRKLTRHAQYIPATAYVEEGLLPEPEGADSTYAERGFKHQPIGKQPDPRKPDPTHGGVIATGGIRRDATLHLTALRLLAAGEDEEKTLSLRRYVLGLALTAFTYSPYGYLRQGCNLVLDPDKPPEFCRVYCDGRREKVTLEHADALKYAKVTARAFGIYPDRKTDHQVHPDREVMFDKDLAMKDVSGGAKTPQRSKKPK